MDDKIIAVQVSDPWAKKYQNIADVSEVERKQFTEFYNEVARQKKKIIETLAFEDKGKAVGVIRSFMI